MIPLPAQYPAGTHYYTSKPWEPIRLDDKDPKSPIFRDDQWDKLRMDFGKRIAIMFEKNDGQCECRTMTIRILSERLIPHGRQEIERSAVQFFETTPAPRSIKVTFEQLMILEEAIAMEAKKLMRELQADASDRHRDEELINIIARRLKSAKDLACARIHTALYLRSLSAT